MREKKLLATTFVCVCFVSGLVLAQVTTGTILGTVRDSTGAVIPGAMIRLKNVETGITRTVTTDSAGRYTTPQLGLGHYEVTAEANGFQTMIRSGMELTLGREAMVDFTLQVGAVADRITVTGEAPLVETTTTELSRLVSGAEIERLPIQGRSLTQLAVLQTGVVAVESQITSPTAGPGMKISVSGSRPNQSTFLLDGGDINNSTNKGVGGMSGLWLGKDTIREFNVLTSNYSAQYGKALGGIINAVSRSGTNELHGTAFWLLRNDNLDARNFFDRKKPEFKRNQFGATLGGPIQRDKTFFFGSYEGFRQNLGQTFTAFVPTASARQGLLPTGQVAVDPAIQPILNLYPLPNARDLGTGVGEHVVAENEKTDEEYYMIKVDHNFSASDSLFARWTFNDSTQGSADPLGFRLDKGMRNQYGTVQETHIFSPALLNVARAHFNRSRYFALPANNPPELIFAPGRPWAGNVRPVGLTDVGNHITTPFNIPINVFDFSDDVTYTRGAHTIKFGVLVRRIQENILRDFRASGTWAYTSLQALLTNRPNRFEGLAPGSLTSQRGFRQSLIGFYAEDSIRVRPGVTLNLALRYEFITNPTEVNGLIAQVPDNWDRDDLKTGVLVDKVFQKNPSLRNWAPRVGVAWDPTGTGRFSIRAGAGIYHDQIIPMHYDYMQWVPPLFNIADMTNPASYPNPFLGVEAIGLQLSPYAASYYTEKTGTAGQWNLSLQTELFPGTMLEVGYVGNRGWNVPVALDPNTSIPEILPDGRLFFPANAPRRNPNWGRLTIVEWQGRSAYDSLQVSAERRYAHGLRIRGNYVWSKALDHGSTIIAADSATDHRARQNPYDLHSNWAVTSWHVGHQFTMNYNYDLPLARQSSGFTRALFGDWEIGGIVRVAQGPWFTGALGLVDRSRALVFEDRPNLAPGASNNPIKGTTAGCPGVAPGQKLGTPQLYFDPCAFEFQEAGFFGNLGRNTLRSAGRATFDLALSKQFPVHRVSEDFRIEFRSEFFNLFNRANFAPPVRNIFNARGEVLGNAGRITSTATSSRQLQFELRFMF